MKKHEFRQETEAVRGGTRLEKKNGPLSTPIYQTSTFEVTDMQEQTRVTSTDSFYTRYGNPTNTVAENAIAKLEGTDAALLFSSGMAAITTSFLSLVKAGDHIVVYCTGLGTVEGTQDVSMPAPSNPPNVTNPVSVMIGSVTVQPSLAGLVAGLTGIYQVQFTVPAGIPPGDCIPLALSVLGQTSVAVNLSVR